MKVLIATRSDAFSRVGGDTIQFLEYVRELQKQGLVADLTTDPNASLRGVSLLHLGGIDRILETLWFWSRAKRARIPTVISPIFHPRDRVAHFDSTQRHELIQQLAHQLLPAGAVEVARSLGYAMKNGRLLLPVASLATVGPERARRRVLADTECWLLIATKEGHTIRSTFGVTEKRQRLIPNGVPDAFLHPSAGRERHGILIVGRIEERKNQLGILRALKGTGVPITVVGASNPFHPKYSDAVLEEISRRPEVTYIPQIAHKDMADLYRRHLVHVSASWYEVAPLVDLEAAASGCAVVASRTGYTNEYLGDSALYVDPQLGEAHLKAVILEALDRAAMLGQAAAEVVQQFRWSNAAQKLRMAYEEVLTNTSATSATDS